MKTLEIKQDAAVEAYKNASQEGKKLLKDLFGDYQFQPITERIKTFQDVLKELDVDEEEFEDYSCNLTVDEYAYKKLKLIVQALNEGWKPDFKNKDEYKYYPWFEVDDAGSACAYSNTAPSHTNALIGSRLCFKSRELALYAGKTFEGIYNDYLL